jgi:hypothetical protein
MCQNESVRTGHEEAAHPLLLVRERIDDLESSFDGDVMDGVCVCHLDREVGSVLRVRRSGPRSFANVWVLGSLKSSPI